ncbi:AAA family ATPase [Streptomyces olivaceus]|uniref:AAA family ATPase n=1 Tax=Streptomyces olivaceus TaxID=47716 RepID=A0ABS7W7C4_STROV|nr:AAA family ATPase [Streptomyces olivaceus]MBZ6091029.1 AAA family ATPase [Streptomyces olivaceus]MBZ6097204.1 AAA family ATPase [Streptomyces olivaceus]MBZ6121417.1 AAA family ATPase [Streptomyces olivaceus]MBZ6153529.1 AAA family ATPase [Streptomyces olivaceus]MBZ6299612.1 AAA family ATPase [Streptomyces olivaceus]
MTPTDPALQRALDRERAHHDHCTTVFAAMVDGAQEHVVTGEDVSASGADAEVLGYRLRSRAEELRELPEGPLFFGRLDFAAGEDPERALHIGRLRITEHPAAPPLVVDWRAPVSRAFYQATAEDPRGVAVRRRFGWAPGGRGAPGDLTGLEDEHLGRGESRASDIVAREIERPRVGPMRDIAATIQPEQDDLVRAGLTTTVCVQGAPGTGKTAVGLHRAAYLLYTHPRRIRRGGLLILGPHPAFLSYIAEVLPALGETGVRQSTLAREIARHPVTRTDGAHTAAVKHDARTAEVLRRALYARVDPEAAGPLAVPDGSYRWRVPAEALARIVADVRAEEPPYTVGRERVRARIVRYVQDSAERRAGPRTDAWVRRVERARPIGAHLDAVWPRVRPEEVVARLLTDSGALARAADGLLDAEEQEALLRTDRVPRSWKSARWSAADLVLLDEVAGLLEHPEGYGHIVVDEAQDLSPMECRAVARRSAFGSLTVLGDLAQGTTPWAARSWPDTLAHLGRPDAAVVPLTTGFRVPQAVVALANRLLERLDVDVPAARSLRGDGELAIRPAGPGRLTGVVVDAVRAALAREGSVAVVAADPDAPRLRDALAAAGIPAAGPGEPDARVAVVPASVVKGLEYDHVVAVEPAAIAEAEGPDGRGLHRLYVVLTRAVSRLDVVHARPLPF